MLKKLKDKLKETTDKQKKDKILNKIQELEMKIEYFNDEQQLSIGTSK